MNGGLLGGARRPMSLAPSGDRHSWASLASVEMPPEQSGIPAFLQLIQCKNVTRDCAIQTLGATVRMPTDCCSQTTLNLDGVRRLEVRIEQLQETEEQLQDNLQEQAEASAQALNDQRMFAEEQLNMLRKAHSAEAEGTASRHTEEVDDLRRRITDLQLERDNLECHVQQMEQQLMLDQLHNQELQLRLGQKDREVFHLQEQLAEGTSADPAGPGGTPDAPQHAWGDCPEEKASDTIQRRIDAAQGVPNQRAADLKARMGIMVEQMQLDRESAKLRRGMRDLEAKSKQLEQDQQAFAEGVSAVALRAFEAEEAEGRVGVYAESLDALVDVLHEAAEGRMAVAAQLEEQVKEREDAVAERVAAEHARRFRKNVRDAAARSRDKPGSPGDGDGDSDTRSSDSGSSPVGGTAQVEDLLLQLISSEVAKYGDVSQLGGPDAVDTMSLFSSASERVLRLAQDAVLDVFGGRLQQLREGAAASSPLQGVEGGDPATATDTTSPRGGDAHAHGSEPGHRMAPQTPTRIPGPGVGNPAPAKETQTPVGVTAEAAWRHCEPTARQAGVQRGLFRRKKMRSALRPVAKTGEEPAFTLGLTNLHVSREGRPRAQSPTGQVSDKTIKSYLFSGHPVYSMRMHFLGTPMPVVA